MNAAMIELERDDSGDFPGQVWHDVEYRHVIVQETADTAPLTSGGPGWYVRDENGETGPYVDLADAFTAASARWGEVTLAPANRLVLNMTYEDETDAGRYLLEYLATYGAVGIDPQALANLAFARLEEE